MNPPFGRIGQLVILSLFAISSVFAAGERNSFDPTQFSTGDFHGCLPTGNGSDPYLNSLKNRDKPPTKAKRFTVTQLFNTLPRTLPARKIHRDKWTPTQQDTAAKWESRPVIVEGYLLHVVKEKKEACNCGSTKYVDHHLWLAASPESDRTDALVVEVSPRVWSNHQGWDKAATFKKIIDSKHKVHVAGWLTWDQEHAEQLTKTRGTLWEVHPIHSIQEQSGNNWVNR